MEGEHLAVVRGGWLWTGSRLIARGGVQIAGGKVEALLGDRDPDPPGAPVIDLPRALVHPGLLDAHAHLDLSGLEGAIPPRLPFPRWLSRLREERRRRGAAGLEEAASAGIKALLATGTTRIVDYSYGGHSEEPLRRSGLRAAVLREVIGPDPVWAARALAEALAWLEARPDRGLLAFGLAPHSPYLATGDLIRRLRGLAGPRLFSIHAAELPGEGEFLRSGAGELREFLAEAGVSLHGFEPPGVGPIEHLERLGALQGTLLVHANHLDRSEVERIRDRGAAVVLCPRSHRYFDRPPHPLPDLLDALVPVALGTDSSASNLGLSVAAEMREVRAAFPELLPELIWALGTGALLPRRFPVPGEGVLRDGGPADLAAADLPAGCVDPLGAFLAEEAPNRLTVAAGRIVHSRP